MATPREIKRRVTSVKSTQKITKAMEMVASVKMRKARDRILSARPYAEKLAEIARHMRSSETRSLSPFLIEREIKKTGLVVVGSDKGLCGSFNANVVKRAVAFVGEHPEKKIELTLLGRKTVDSFKRRNIPVAQRYTDIFFNPKYEDALKVADKIIDDFLAERVDEVYVVYNEFKNAVVQKTVLERILPVAADEVEKKDAKKAGGADYLFEPDPEQTLEILLPRYVRIQVWRMFLESYASEQGARMAAMNGATKNAGELIERLTLFYNKARQALITKELLEVVGGAEALR